MRRIVSAVGVAVFLLVVSAASVLNVPERARGLPAVDYIKIVDAPGGAGSWVSGRNYMFGDTEVLWVAGYNATSGYVSEVTALWRVNEGSPAIAPIAVTMNVSYGPSVRVTTLGYGETTIVVTAEPGTVPLTNATGPIRVSVANVDSAVIRTASGGLGSWAGDASYPEGTGGYLYVAAYNATAGYLGDINANWTSSNPAVALESALYQRWFVRFYGLKGGTAHVDAEPVGTTLANATGTLTVVGIDFVEIVDAPGGVGTWVSGRSYLLGDRDTYYAAGYNSTSGWVEDIVNVVQWFPQSGGNVVSANWNIGGTTLAVTAVGYGVAKISMSYYNPSGNHLYNTTGPLRVSVANVDSVVIRTQRGGVGTWVGDRTYLLGGGEWYYAAAYNTTGGYLGEISSNWTSTNPSAVFLTDIGNGSAVGVSIAVAHAASSGYAYVSVAPVGTSLTNTTGNLSVRGISSVRIVDAPGGTGSWVSGRNYLFGETETLYCAGYDSGGAWVADVVAQWSASPDSAGTGGNVVTFSPRGYSSSVLASAVGSGAGTLIATYFPLSGNPVSNATGPLHVSVANVDSVVVRRNAGGLGTWAGDWTYNVGDWDRFYAAAYNATAGYLGDISSDWTSTDPNVIMPDGLGNLYPSMYVQAAYAGSAYVTAAPLGTSLTNTTGKLTVVGAGIDYVHIRDAPNGGGQVVGSRTYYSGEQDTFYAATYNNTLGYRGDATADWGSNDTAVCQVLPTQGSSVEVLMRTPGTCAITATTVLGGFTNTTGPLAVLPRTVVTVDDSGGADFTTIQAAVDYAQVGYAVYVYNGTYNEHVVVTKEIEIEGQSKQDKTHQSVILDGGNTGTALFIGADRVVIHNLTIQHASYGVFQDHTNNTRLYDSVVQDYGKGVYNNYTLDAWVAYNLITRGQIGVVAYKAYDDAIRWNEISFNSQYGGKGYNAHLRNCFNWNDLHDNHIGYWYDPTTDLPPMEFDGNVITDNDIGVKVSDSSAITLTNNTLTGGQTGVELVNSSSEVRANNLSGMGAGIRFKASSSNLTGNTIAAVDVGIIGDGGSPRIVGNDITVASGNAMALSNLDGAVIQGNDLHGGTILITDSVITLLAPVNSNVVLVDTVVETLSPDAVSHVEVRWSVRVRAVDANGGGLAGASVSARDAQANTVFSGATGPDGFTPPFLLITEVRTANGTVDRNPFTFEVTYGSVTASLTVAVSRAGDITVRLSVGTPIGIVAVLAAAVLASASLAGILAVDRSRYALFLFLMPLYSRLSRDKALENYNRGRVYEYVELNPGVHFHGLLAALGLNNGTLVYHLEVLRKEGLVTSRQEGMYRRFYPKGARLPPTPENGTTPAQQVVLRVIEEMPGITQKQLARFLGLPPSTLVYQIAKLSAKGLVASEKRGRKIHYAAAKGETAKKGGT